MEVYLGIDIGSVTAKLAILNSTGELIYHLYLPTEGRPVAAVQTGLGQIKEQIPENTRVAGVAVTGSARYLAGAIVGADLVKNEITAHAVAALHYVPDVKTVIDIGGQDSKVIIVRDGVVTDFGMNTVCAAGTGSFLDHQAGRIGITIEEFARRALRSKNPVKIAGRCTVFAETDMIHKQQVGHEIDDILYGLCQALVRNYLNNVGAGKDIKPPIVFQGGVAFNRSMVKALEEGLGIEVIVPPHHEVMGAIGAALLVHGEMTPGVTGSNFKGFSVGEAGCPSLLECEACY